MGVLCLVETECVSPAVCVFVCVSVLRLCARVCVCETVQKMTSVVCVDSVLCSVFGDGAI